MKDAQRGFTLVEILVALAIVGIIVVGTLGAVGFASFGGFLEGFPTSLISGRVAKDITAASVYLHALQEFVARKSREADSKNLADTAEGTYDCFPNPGGCTGSLPVVNELAGFPDPKSQSAQYQLDWKKLEVRIEKWYWDTTKTPHRYSDEAVATENTKLGLIRVQSKLVWELKGQQRSLAVDRFIPVLP